MGLMPKAADVTQPEEVAAVLATDAAKAAEAWQAVVDGPASAPSVADVVDQWIARAIVEGPSPHQMHFGIYLRSRIGELLSDLGI
jgi:hypothetical protein